jgi:hypothetical protein
MQQIQACARKHKITIALGFTENDHNSLYIAQCIITSTGELAMRRRKLMPTHMERTIFGNSSGSSLDNVVAVSGVGNVGQLACWEHAQPLLKYHTITQRETFHVAAWPPVYEMASEAELWSMSRDGTQSEQEALGGALSRTWYADMLFFSNRRMPQSLSLLRHRIPVFRAAHHLSALAERHRAHGHQQRAHDESTWRREFCDFRAGWTTVV